MHLENIRSSSLIKPDIGVTIPDEVDLHEVDWRKGRKMFVIMPIVSPLEKGNINAGLTHVVGDGNQISGEYSTGQVHPSN